MRVSGTSDVTQKAAFSSKAIAAYEAAFHKVLLINFFMLRNIRLEETCSDKTGTAATMDLSLLRPLKPAPCMLTAA